MNLIRTASLVLLVSASGSATAMQPDSTAHRLSDVVVTGTRSETDIRHLPMTVTVIDRKTLPASLEVTSELADGTIMGVRHREYDVEGIQFHPESILTPGGKKMMENFLVHLG